MKRIVLAVALSLVVAGAASGGYTFSNDGTWLIAFKCPQRMEIKPGTSLLPVLKVAGQMVGTPAAVTAGDLPVVECGGGPAYEVRQRLTAAQMRSGVEFTLFSAKAFTSAACIEIIEAPKAAGHSFRSTVMKLFGFR